MNTKRPPLAWAALGLLMALVATNAVFLVLVRTGGPLVGLLFYAALLIAVWRGRRPDWRAVVVGGLVGFAVHVVEVAAGGWTAFPLLVALNLILPLALAPVAWLVGREVMDAHLDR